MDFCIRFKVAHWRSNHSLCRIPDVSTPSSRIHAHQLLTQQLPGEKDVSNARASAVELFAPMFQFVDQALDEGRSVLIHCMSGAHRAGTTGTAYLMHVTPGLSARAAMVHAQQLRSVVDPWPGFGGLLLTLEAALQVKEITYRPTAPTAVYPKTHVAKEERLIEESTAGQDGVEGPCTKDKGLAPTRECKQTGADILVLPPAQQTRKERDRPWDCWGGGGEGVRSRCSASSRSRSARMCRVPCVVANGGSS
jgi:hypothetical protein